MHAVYLTSKIAIFFIIWTFRSLDRMYIGTSYRKCKTNLKRRSKSLTIDEQIDLHTSFFKCACRIHVQVCRPQEAQSDNVLLQFNTAFLLYKPYLTSKQEAHMP